MNLLPTNFTGGQLMDAVNGLPAGTFAGISARSFPVAVTRLGTAGWSAADGIGSGQYTRWQAPMAELAAGGEDLWWTYDAGGGIWFLDEDRPNDTQFGGDFAQAVAYCADRRRSLLIKGAVTVPSDAAISTDWLDLQDAGGSITGGDYTGVTITGTDCHVSVVGVEIIGFGDGTDDQRLNYTTGFVNFSTGTTVEYLGTVGIRARDCRVLFWAGGAASDVTCDKTIVIDRWVRGTEYTDNCMKVYDFRCVVKTATGGGGEFYNCIGAAREVGPIIVYLDGLGDPDDDAYAIRRTQHFWGDKARTIWNKHSSTSAAFGNYETHMYQLSGWCSTIIEPDCEDVIGTVNEDGDVLDAEAVYTKSYRSKLAGGRLKNAGWLEGAVAMKGNAPGSTVSGNAQGAHAEVDGTEIEFDTWTALDASAVEHTCRRRGAVVAAPTGCRINVTTKGCNADSDVTVDGYLDSFVGFSDRNEDVQVTVRSLYSRSTNGVVLRGGFYDPQVDLYATDVATNGATWTGINTANVAGRGLSFRNPRLRVRVQANNPDMSGFDFIGIRLDNNKYDWSGGEFIVDLWDVVATGAVQKPISFDENFVDGEPATGEADGIKVVIRGIKYPMADQPLHMDNVFNPKSMKFDIEWVWRSTANGAVTAGLIRVDDGCYITAKLEGTARRIDGGGYGALIQPPIYGAYRAASGTLTIDGAQSVGTPVGSKSSGSDYAISMSPSSNTLRARVDGHDGETADFALRFTGEVCRAT